MPSSRVGDRVWVCQYFAKRRIGALIVLENNVQLGDMMQGGVVLDARISRELLLTIFFPNTALHDGAVIIRKGRIAAAGCILPLAQMDRQNFGTRHRAALGATEVSDATVIVVSEERGEVSVASKGHLAIMPAAEQLRETLNNVIQHCTAKRQLAVSAGGLSPRPRAVLYAQLARVDRTRGRGAA